MTKRSPSPISDSPNGFLSLANAARWADVSPKTINRWISKGLPFFQVGPRTKVLIAPEDIREFLTRRQVPKSKLDDMVDTVMGELKA